MLGDPDLIVATLLRNLIPTVTVETQLDGAKALSSPGYVLVQTRGGTTPWIDVLDEPDIEVVVYSNVSRKEASRLSRQIQSVLHEAFVNQTATAEGYLAAFSTNIRPNEQRLDGIPAGVFRFSAQYALATRPSQS